MEQATLTIGEIARRAGINASAIRYYEDRGILPAPERVSGQRRYTEQTLQQLRVIDVTKRAGFTLADIRVLLSVDGGHAPAGPQLQAMARRKLPDVEALITEAQAVRSWLTVASGCGCDTLDACALFGQDFEAPDRRAPARLDVTLVG